MEEQANGVVAELEAIRERGYKNAYQIAGEFYVDLNGGEDRSPEAIIAWVDDQTARYVALGMDERSAVVALAMYLWDLKAQPNWESHLDDKVRRYERFARRVEAARVATLKALEEL